EYAFKGGTSQDPEDRPGVANMVAALIDEGAGDLDARAFQEKMEQLAVELRFNADRDHFRGSLRTLTERLDEASELLRLALNHPRFDPDAIERIRTQLVVSLRHDATNPTDMASKAWWKAAFPNHPYGWPEKGTQETIAQIKADELRSYATRIFAKDQLKVAIVGDIDLASAGKLLDKVFGALPAKAQLATVRPQQPAGLGERQVVPFDVPQAVVSMGGIGLPRKHPDFITAFVVNHILGGGSFTSRLYQEVREKRGLAYGVSTYLYPMEYSALFMGWTQVRADRAGEAIGIIEAETRQMAANGPTQEELDKAKAYLKGSYALRFDTSTKIAGQLVQIQLDELGIDYINKRNDLIDAVTLAETKRVAKALLETPLLTVIVGKPAGITSTPQRPPG
ncbi:MAG TPA: pitrilysin family protein, partial [Albitalea sp.]|nr:pitrilysin family protein [Albitalea sp.]